MRTINKFLMGLVAWIFIVSTASAATTYNTACDQRRLAAMQKMVNGGSDLIIKTIPQPNLSAIENCLSQIKIPQFGFGSMSLPSIQGLLSKVCNMMVSQINSETSGMNYTFGANGFGNGSGSGTQALSYPSQLGTYANQLGVSTSSSTSPSTIGGASNAISQLDTSSTTGSTSNSSYMSSTVNSAMQYLTGPSATTGQ